jgi:hypothetical protein
MDVNDGFATVKFREDWREGRIAEILAIIRAQ